MYGKNNMEAYITIWKIDSQWEFVVWLRKPKQGLCINLEGWDREGDRREVKKGRDICIQTPGVGVGQGGLACCNSWGRKESDMTERLILSYLMADSC